MEDYSEIFGRLRALEMTLEGHLASCTESRKSVERSLSRMEATLNGVQKSVESVKDEVHFEKAQNKGKGQAFKLIFTTFLSTLAAIGSLWVVIEYFIK